MQATAQSARARLAKLLNGKAEDIALLWNATAGLHAVAMGMDWRAGDNVVVAASEFPSVLHVWQANGVELNRVGAQPVVTLEEVAAAVNARTRAIVVSHVSYLTGARSDLAALREIADRVGARLIVDASHALGVVAVDGALCDAVVSCCYKWMYGTHGVAVFYVNSARWPDLQPKAVGWNAVMPEPDWTRRESFELKPTMERFEGGNPSYMNIYYLENALKTLDEVGAADIEAHVLDVGGELHARLERLGVPLLTPRARAQRAGNISIATDRSDVLEAYLRDRGVLTWGGDGRLRISVHAHNDLQDVERVVDELAQLAM